MRDRKKVKRKNCATLDYRVKLNVSLPLAWFGVIIYQARSRGSAWKNDAEEGDEEIVEKDGQVEPQGVQLQ